MLRLLVYFFGVLFVDGIASLRVDMMGGRGIVSVGCVIKVERNLKLG